MQNIRLKAKLKRLNRADLKLRRLSTERKKGEGASVRDFTEDIAS